MRLCIISTVRGYSWAGSEELWLATAQIALEKGIDVEAVLHGDLHAGRPLTAFVDRGGFLSEWRTRPIARLSPVFDLVAPNFSDTRFKNPEVILVSTGALSSLQNVPGLIDYLEKTRTRFVLLTQFNADCLPISPETRKRVRELLKKSAPPVFVSEQNKRLAERQFNLDLQSAEVIYNPIRHQRDEPMPMPDPGSVRLACVARFEILWKSQDLLVELMATEKWKNRPLEVNFYGEGPDLEHVRSLAKRLGVENKIHFKGYVRDLEQVWSQNHAMVLPSKGEGTPLAALEAMMFGRPVITTDVGGNREVLREGVDGFIADAATLTSLDRTMEIAWEQKDKWPEMGINAHQRAKQMARAIPEQKLFSLLA